MQLCFDTEFNDGNARRSAQRKHGSGITYILYQHLTDDGMRRLVAHCPHPKRTVQGRINISQPLSHMCIDNSCVTYTQFPSTASLHFWSPLTPPRVVLFKCFVPLLRAYLHRRLRQWNTTTAERKSKRDGKKNKETNVWTALLNNLYPSIRTYKYTCANNYSTWNLIRITRREKMEYIVLRNIARITYFTL